VVGGWLGQGVPAKAGLGGLPLANWAKPTFAQRKRLGFRLEVGGLAASVSTVTLAGFSRHPPIRPHPNVPRGTFLSTYFSKEESF